MFMPFVFYTAFNLSDIVQLRAGTHQLENIKINIEIGTPQFHI